MRKIIIIGIIVGTIAVAVIFGFLIKKHIKENTPNDARIDLSTIYKTEGDEAIILFDRERLEDMALFSGESAYLTVEFAKTYISDKLYFDNNELIMSYTTPTQLIRSFINERFYTVNGVRRDLGEPVTIVTEDDKIYVSLRFLERYCNYEHMMFFAPNRLMITTETEPDCEEKQYDTWLTTKAELQMRVEPTIKSEIINDINLGTRVYVIEEDIHSNKRVWYKVMTLDGYTGYIEKQEEDIVEKVERPQGIHSYKYTQLSREDDIVLAWHQVTSVKANDNLDKVIESAVGLDVISPTWFNLKDGNGEINDIGSKEYVELAHSKGLEVWALVANQFNKTITKELLQYTSRRDTFVENIIELAQKYQLDGINIDFESFNSAEGEAFTQLIRELSIRCRELGIVLSVDIYVPSPWNMFMDRTRIAEAADYLIIMGYDEHWSTSPESGSVSSMGFFEKGLLETMELAPAHKIIMGLPFYTRIWEEKDGKLVNNKAYSMSGTRDKLTKNEAVIQFDKETGQNYAEYIIEDSTFRVWLEDEVSMRSRLQIIKREKVAGMAAWKIGLESKEIWAIIDEYQK